MRIGLLIAIERELNSFLNIGVDIKTYKIHNRTIYNTKINNNDIYAIQSGCGIIDASSATQLLICQFDVELVVNFGVAGALDKSLNVSDLFVVKGAVNYMYDVSPLDPVLKHQYEEYDDIFIPLSRSEIDWIHKIYPDIIDAYVASGDRFISEKSDKDELRDLGCNICDMEIAGIARVCNICNVKCVSIKCISDTYDGNGEDFTKNVVNSANKAFKVIYDLLKVL